MSYTVGKVEWSGPFRSVWKETVEEGIFGSLVIVLLVYRRDYGGCWGSSLARPPAGRFQSCHREKAVQGLATAYCHGVPCGSYTNDLLSLDNEGF